jgi:hypothetical protein
MDRRQSVGSVLASSQPTADVKPNLATRTSLTFCAAFRRLGECFATLTGSQLPAPPGSRQTGSYRRLRKVFAW